MPPNSFTLVFLEEQTKEVIKEVRVGGGSGGSRTIIKEKNITEYIEVPNYITIYEKEQNETEISQNEAENDTEKTSQKIGGIILIIISIIGLIILWKNRPKKYKESKVSSYN